MRVEEIPHPMATLAINDRGGKSFETMVTGIWKTICRINKSMNTLKWCQIGGTDICDEENWVDYVEELARRVTAERVFRKSL